MTTNTKATAACLPEARLSIVAGSRSTLDLPTHILRQVAAPINFDAVSRTERWELVRGLLWVLNEGVGGSGLAAPMTGVALRVVVSIVGGDPLVMLNPQILTTQGQQWTETEGNLCLPGIRAPVRRPYAANIQWQSINSGRQQSATFEGWHARVLMHEIEILDGRLFVDHASEPPTGNWVPEEARALRAASVLFGGSPSSSARSDALGLATLPPSLSGLDGVLTRRASEIDLGAMDQKYLRSLVHSMFRVLYEKRGVGLAAPQVGLGARLAVIDSGDKQPLALINPRIVDHDERQEVTSEGCLSLPGWRGDVPRWTGVKVATETINGETVELDFSGFPARIAQHEIDHLDGLLYPKRMDTGTELLPTDPDFVTNDMVRALKQREAQDSRQSVAANRAKVSAKRRVKRRR